MGEVTVSTVSEGSINRPRPRGLDEGGRLSMLSICCSKMGQDDVRLTVSEDEDQGCDAVEPCRAPVVTGVKIRPAFPQAALKRAVAGKAVRAMRRPPFTALSGWHEPPTQPQLEPDVEVPKEVQIMIGTSQKASGSVESASFPGKVPPITSPSARGGFWPSFASSQPPPTPASAAGGSMEFGETLSDLEFRLKILQRFNDGNSELDHTPRKDSLESLHYSEKSATRECRFTTASTATRKTLSAANAEAIPAKRCCRRCLERFIQYFEKYPGRALLLAIMLALGTMVTFVLTGLFTIMILVIAFIIILVLILLWPW